jgi:protein MAK11
MRVNVRCRVHDWALLHVLGGHKSAVTSIDIHPSGRMALSVSADR